eukprot:scaffold624_cov402-Prasinococcus_capsulatus_cf.AAC.14
MLHPQHRVYRMGKQGACHTCAPSRSITTSPLRSAFLRLPLDVVYPSPSTSINSNLYWKPEQPPPSTLTRSTGGASRSAPSSSSWRAHASLMIKSGPAPSSRDCSPGGAGLAAGLEPVLRSRAWV